MEQLIEKMKVLLATNFAFYLKLHFFHWNVTGSNFPQYHKFFEKLYTEVWEASDGIAEHIRAIKGFAPGSFSRYKEMSLIEDQVDVIPAEQMISIALYDNDKVLTALTDAYKLAEQNAEHGLSNFLQDRIDIHKKHGWMLRSTLG
jgi:starvation-inducible DNA-binding protein